MDQYVRLNQAENNRTDYSLCQYMDQYVRLNLLCLMVEILFLYLHPEIHLPVSLLMHCIMVEIYSTHAGEHILSIFFYFLGTALPEFENPYNCCIHTTN